MRIRSAFTINNIYYLTTGIEQSLTDDEQIALHEGVRRYFKVQRRGSFPDSAAGVIVGTMAGTIITTEVSRVGDGYASQMRANTNYN